MQDTEQCVWSSFNFFEGYPRIDISGDGAIMEMEYLGLGLPSWDSAESPPCLSLNPELIKLALAS